MTFSLKTARHILQLLGSHGAAVHVIGWRENERVFPSVLSRLHSAAWWCLGGEEAECSWVTPVIRGAASTAHHRDETSAKEFEILQRLFSWIIVYYLYMLCMYYATWLSIITWPSFHWRNSANKCYFLAQNFHYYTLAKFVCIAYGRTPPLPCNSCISVIQNVMIGISGIESSPYCPSYANEN